MLKRALIQQFKFTQFTVLKNLEGVTHKESLTGPDPAGNCANWVLGHIVWSRGLIHKLIGEKQSLHEEKAAFYQRGGEPIGEGSGAVVALEELLGAFISSHATLKTALEEMSELACRPNVGRADQHGVRSGETAMASHQRHLLVRQRSAQSPSVPNHLVCVVGAPCLHLGQRHSKAWQSSQVVVRDERRIDRRANLLHQWL